ncbi:hypothetical protein D3C76_1516790 [compost metagenome]
MPGAGRYIDDRAFLTSLTKLIRRDLNTPTGALNTVIDQSFDFFIANISVCVLTLKAGVIDHDVEIAECFFSMIYGVTKLFPSGDVGQEN